MLVNDKNWKCTRFVALNGLLENPASFEKKRTMINHMVRG